MSNKQKARADQPVAETALRARQRKKLIDACISALHTYGPSRTTIDKVVSIAQMSPGIVNFYFETKAAMMVAALEFLSAEFEEKVLAPVTALRETPVQALELLIDLYLDPELASPRKVSVWYAFWGEANSRQEYHDICGNKDDSFAALVRDLVERLIRQTGDAHLDADGVALGLIGALEILWQNLAFQDEADLDRLAYKRRCIAYLRSVFPGRFGGTGKAVAKALPAKSRKADAALPGWAYADADLFAVERDRLFHDGWQFAGHECQLPEPGDYLTFDLLGERALVLRDSAGELKAFRNACRQRPHALSSGPAGHFLNLIRCPVDGLVYGFDGRLHRVGPEISLARFDVSRAGGLIFVRIGEGAGLAPDLAGLMGAPMALVAPPDEIEVAADWKVVVEQWLDSSFPVRGKGRMAGLVGPRAATLAESPDHIAWRAVLSPQAADGWTARRYAALAGQDGGESVWRRVFAYPNLLIEVRPDALEIRQVLPAAPGQSLVRRLRYAGVASARLQKALSYLGSRLTDPWFKADIEVARSTQVGLTAPSYEPGIVADDTRGAARLFRAWLRARLPELTAADA